MSEHKSPIPSMIYNAAVGGHVTNSQQIIDDNLNREQSDINQEVLFGEPYNSTTPNGMGRIVLKKKDNFKQVVEAQTNGNTIFIIKYDFILTGNVTIPSNCILQFEGGSINGDYTITGNNTIIKAEAIKIFNTDVTIDGTWRASTAYLEWFGAVGDGVTDDTNAFLALNNICLSQEPYSPKLGDIVLGNKTYIIKQLINIKYNIIGCAESKLLFDGGYFEYSYARGLDDLICFSSVKFTATENSPRIFEGNNANYVINKCVFENCYDIFNKINEEEDAWTGNLTFNDCIFMDITNIVISAQYWLNRIGFNNCIFRRVNYILDGSFACGVLFNNCDIENIHLFKRSVTGRGIEFIGCYIEGCYTTDSNEGLIKLTDPLTGTVTFDNCFINSNGNYIVYENDNLTIDWSIQKGIIKFNNCTIFRYDSFELFRIGNKATIFIYIEGIKALIGKLNYNSIIMFTNVSDIINNTNRIITNIQTYQYREGKYVNTTSLLSGPTGERPLGVGAENLTGILDTIKGIGFQYFDTTLGKPIYAKEIATNGTVTWVDATGAQV